MASTSADTVQLFIVVSFLSSSANHRRLSFSFNKLGGLKFQLHLKDFGSRIFVTLISV
jgi:hypothetical protein